MDKALFVGTSGAKNSMRQLEIITNNLANVNTTGFRADYEVMKQYNIHNKDDQSRSYSKIDSTYSDFKMGPIIHTNRDLDVSLSSNGFIAVQSKLGKEGYTRAGNLQIKDGFLKTQYGDLVLGTKGPIPVSNVDRLMLGEDGTVSARLIGADRTLVTLDRIKLVDPPTHTLHKDSDGLFYPGEGSDVKRSEKVKLVIGTLEGSNVDPVQTLTSLIEVSRQFEMHTNMMKTMQDEATKANQMMSLGR